MSEKKDFETQLNSDIEQLGTTLADKAEEISDKVADSKVGKAILGDDRDLTGEDLERIGGKIKEGLKGAKEDLKEIVDDIKKG